MTYEEVLAKLKTLADPDAVRGMSRFGINTDNTLGISISKLRTLAKKIGNNHAIAQGLWRSEIHEARILASMIDKPKLVTENQMENWVKEFDSWDVCDQVCNNLFRKTNKSYKMAVKWSERQEEFVKRAGFVLMATLAVHDKESKNQKFIELLQIVKDKAEDDRNYVKKAISWALRQIGKRNITLNQVAIETAKDIQGSNAKGAQWIASDALKELTGDKVRKRFG